MATTQPTDGTIPENQFRPANTIDASTPLPDDVATNDEPLIEGSDPSDEHAEQAGETAARAEARAAVESEARDGGWISESEWMASHGGSKQGWRPADVYVEHRRQVLPIVQKEARALRAEVAALKAWRDQSEKDQRERSTRIETTALTAELRESAESGDWDRHAELIKKIATTVAPPPAAAPAGVDPVFKAQVEEFASSNQWLKTDQEASRVFARELKLIVDTNTADNLGDALRQAREEVRRRFPEKFRRAPTSSMGETGGESTRANGGGKNHTWSNLKPEFRQQAEKDIAAKRYSQKDYLANCTDEYFRT